MDDWVKFHFLKVIPRGTNIQKKSAMLKLLLSACVSAILNVSATKYTQVGIYLEWGFDWANMESEIQQALLWGYDRIYVGFHMSSYGCQAACLEWQLMSAERKSSVKTEMESYGAKLYLSLGGPTDYIEGLIESGNAMVWGQTAGDFAKDNLFDGINIAIALVGEPTPDTPSQYVTNGQFLQVAKDVSTGVKNAGFRRNQISLTSHAPFFSDKYMGGASSSLAYLSVYMNNGQTWAVSDLNLDMFNEANDYMSYNDIFVANTNRPGSAVLEIQNQGVHVSNIAVLKPVSPNISPIKSDYVDYQTLASWGCRANSKSTSHQNGFSWTGGFVGWTWNNDEGSVENFASVKQNNC